MGILLFVLPFISASCGVARCSGIREESRFESVPHDWQKSNLAKDIFRWSTKDVCQWATEILGFDFLVPVFEKYKVDGLTLLNMSEADIYREFGDQNSLVIKKITAHIRLLQGSCICGVENCPSSDFFIYYYKSRDKTWPLYIASLLTPRYTLIKERSKWQEFRTSTELPQHGQGAILLKNSQVELVITSWLSVISFWMGVFLCPSLMFIHVASTWAKSNYIVFAIYSLSQVMLQVLEYRLLWSCKFKSSRDMLYTGLTLVFPIAITLASKLLNLILPFTARDFLLYSLILLQAAQISSVIYSHLSAAIRKFPK